MSDFVSSEFQSLLYGLYIISNEWAYYKVLNPVRGLDVVLYLLMNEFVFVDLVKDLHGPNESACKEVIQSAH